MKLYPFLITILIGFLLTSCSSRREVSPQQRESDVLIQKEIKEKDLRIKTLEEELSKMKEENQELKEKLSSLGEEVSTFKTRMVNEINDWNRKYTQQALTLVIFQIFNYVQQEGTLPPDLSLLLVDQENWEYERISETDFTVRSRIFPEFRYSGSIKPVERIVAPPSDWIYTGQVIFQNQVVAMINNPSTGETRFVKKGDWIDTFQVEEVTPQAILLKSGNAKSRIPYTGG